jgi:hypothetical protein
MGSHALDRTRILMRTTATLEFITITVMMMILYASVRDGNENMEILLSLLLIL